MKPLNELTATEIVRALDAGHTTCEAVTRACLDHIREREPEVDDDGEDRRAVVGGQEAHDLVLLVADPLGDRGAGPGQLAVAWLERPDAALGITPEGRFSDPRERPVRLEPGLAHLARRLDRGVFLPLALEYPFWQERTPEALACFGAPVSAVSTTSGGASRPDSGADASTARTVSWGGAKTGRRGGAGGGTGRGPPPGPVLFHHLPRPPEPLC